MTARVKPKIYIAAPLFSEGERQFNLRLRAALSPYAETYLPQQDGALLTDLLTQGLAPAKAKEIIFAADIDALSRCDLLLFVMDGRVPDEGACVELGYAYARGKKCVGLKTDPRRLLAASDNPMIEGMLAHLFSDIESLSDWIKSARM